MRDLTSRFDDLLDILAGAPDAVGFASDPVVEARGDQFGGLSVGVRYSDGSELHLEIWADCSQEHSVWTSYRVHYQDVRAACRFRYDNADHRAQLSNFHHHLHVGSAPHERLYPLGPPGPCQVIQSIEWHLAHLGE